MDNCFLIAHKVRGEPALDVATRIECAECNGEEPPNGHCPECDDFGFWWIVPTSGHRAYPFISWELSSLRFGDGVDLPIVIPAMPANLPDHYAVRASPRSQPAQAPAGLASLLASARKANLPTLTDRRGF